MSVFRPPCLLVDGSRVQLAGHSQPPPAAPAGGLAMQTHSCSPNRFVATLVAPTGVGNRLHGGPAVGMPLVRLAVSG